MSLLALSAPQCTVCHGTGVSLHLKVCDCVWRQLGRDRWRCGDRYERLWVDALAFPHNFPPGPIATGNQPLVACHSELVWKGEELLSHWFICG